MVRGIPGLLIVLAACFDPALPQGAPCDNGQLCPPGQFCSVERVCTRIARDGGDGDGDGDGDGGVDGGVDGDGNLGDPVEPHELSGSSNCRIESPVLRQALAVDQGDRVYLAASCDDEAAVAVSVDGGATFRAFSMLGIQTVADDVVSIVAGADGKAVVTALTMNGIVASVTDDGGASWSSAQPVADAGPSQVGISMAFEGNVVLVAAEDGPDLRVSRNDSFGVGNWTSTTIQTPIVYGDVLMIGGSAFVVGDTPQIVVHESTDSGQSFGPDTMPVGQGVQYSDWDLTGDSIVGVGTGMDARRLAVDDLSVVEELELGLPMTSPRQRTVSALSSGEFFVGSHEGGDSVYVYQFRANGSTDRRRVDDGDEASVFAVSEGVVLITYRKDGALWFTAQVFGAQ